MISLYNYIHSYFYKIEDNKDNKDNKDIKNIKNIEDIKEYPIINQIDSNVILNPLLIHEQINFEKNIQKYNPKYKIRKPYIQINQD